MYYHSTKAYEFGDQYQQGYKLTRCDGCGLGIFSFIQITFAMLCSVFSTYRSFSYNVRSVKKDTKRSSNTLLCLVSFFTERTLLTMGEGKS